MKQLILSIVTLLMLATPAFASDAFLYSQDTNHITMMNGVTLPVSSHTEFTADRFSTRYFTTTDYTNGYSSSYGYVIPAARNWQCIGSGCSKTGYLSYLRYQASHPVLANVGVNYYTLSVTTPAPGYVSLNSYAYVTY